ncbi:hypothetical protein Micbo1qcDRAFT_160598, partial [Microdochium bolleyi]
MAMWTRAPSRLLPNSARLPSPSLYSTHHSAASLVSGVHSSKLASAHQLSQHRPLKPLHQQALSAFYTCRLFSTSQAARRDGQRPTETTIVPENAAATGKNAEARSPAVLNAQDRTVVESPAENNETVEPAEKLEFGRSEKANRAAEVNYQARLSKEGKEQKKGRMAALRDAKRLLTLVKPETRPLTGAIGLLFVSSAVTMTVPWSVGKIMDLSNVPLNEASVFGLSIYEFFGAYIAILCLGAAAN